MKQTSTSCHSDLRCRKSIHLNMQVGVNSNYTPQLFRFPNHFLKFEKHTAIERSSTYQVPNGFVSSHQVFASFIEFKHLVNPSFRVIPCNHFLIVHSKKCLIGLLFSRTIQKPFSSMEKSLPPSFGSTRTLHPHAFFVTRENIELSRTVFRIDGTRRRTLGIGFDYFVSRCDSSRLMGP